MNKYSSRMILILTLGVFGILNTEMGIVGILPMIAEQYNVSIATAGWLVSGFALVVAAAGPTMPLLCSKMNRKALMLVAGGIFMISNIISAFCSEFYHTAHRKGDPRRLSILPYVSMALTEAGKAGKAGGIGQGL